MDWGLFILFVVLTLGLGFLSYQDRLFGIAGILLGFLGGAYIYNDNGTTGITYSNTYSVTGAGVIPYLLILFVLIILDITIVVSITRTMKQTTFHPAEG